MLSLVRRKVWNHYFPYQTKQVITSHSGTIPYHQNTRVLTVKASAWYHKAELVFQGHIHLLITQAYIDSSADTYNYQKRSVMLISRPTWMQRGFPSSQDSWLPFVLVSSSYSSLSFDYIAIRYANAWDLEKYFFKHQIVWAIRPILFSCIHKQLIKQLLSKNHLCLQCLGCVKNIQNTSL